MYEASLLVIRTGVDISTSGTSATATIPNASNDAVPRFIRVASTAPAYVKLGPTAVAGDLLVNPETPLILTVPKGTTQVSALQVSAAGLVQISPLEN